MEQDIINIVSNMRNKLGLLYFFILIFCVPQNHFLNKNDFAIDTKKLNDFRGDNMTKYELFFTCFISAPAKSKCSKVGMFRPGHLKHYIHSFPIMSLYKGYLLL